MKKLLLILIAMLFGMQLKAQPFPNTAVDFTVTDIHGQEINLFSILDNGQYVLIDFFSIKCSSCVYLNPHLVEAYHSLGCNMHDIFIMEISPRDDNETLQQFVDECGIEYPTIGTEGGGPDIFSYYNIAFCPTLLLIAPDHTVVKNLYPVFSGQELIEACEEYGIQQHECVPPVYPTVEITLDNVTTTTIEASFAPNETCASYYILSGNADEIQNWANTYGVSIAQLVKQWGTVMSGDYTHVFNDLIPGTEYTIYTRAFDADNKYSRFFTDTITTNTSEDYELSTIELSIPIVADTTVNTLAVPNDKTAAFHVGLITAEHLYEIGIDSALYYIRNDGNPRYSIDSCSWTNLQPHTEYYAIASGQNANGEWGETTIVEFITNFLAVDNHNNDSYRVFPNPTNDYVVIKGNNIKEVTIYNVIGQEVKHERASSEQVIINTSAMQNGIYFAKINNEETIRFVVNK